MKKLKNGAIMIGMLMNEHGDVFVAAETDGMAGSPFATWAMGSDESTYWGHYFETQTEAMRDLIKRAGIKEAA